MRRALMGTARTVPMSLRLMSTSVRLPRHGLKLQPSQSRVSAFFPLDSDNTFATDYPLSEVRIVANTGGEVKCRRLSYSCGGWELGARAFRCRRLLTDVGTGGYERAAGTARSPDNTRTGSIVPTIPMLAPPPPPHPHPKIHEKPNKTPPPHTRARAPPPLTIGQPLQHSPI